MKRPVIITLLFVLTALTWAGLRVKEIRRQSWIANANLGDIEKFTKDHPDEPDALLRLGILLRNAGERGESEKILQHAVELVPYKEKYWIELSRSMDDHNAAVGKMNDYLKINAESAPAMAEISRHFLKMGDIPHARRIAEKAVKLAPNSAAAWRSLGDAMVVMRRLPEAEKDFRKSLALQGDAETRLSLARLFIPLQRYAEMIEVCEPILRARQGSDISPQQHLRAILYINGGRLYEPLNADEIVSVQNQIREVDTQSSILDPAERFLPPYFLGESYLRAGKPVEAIPYLERSAALGTMYTGNLYSLARAYRLAGNITKADAVNARHVRLSRMLRDMERYIDRLDDHPGETVTMLRLADTLVELGNKADAAAIYQQVIASGKSSDVAQRKLNELSKAH